MSGSVNELMADLARGSLTTDNRSALAQAAVRVKQQGLCELNGGLQQHGMRCAHTGPWCSVGGPMCVCLSGGGTRTRATWECALDHFQAVWGSAILRGGSSFTLFPMGRRFGGGELSGRYISAQINRGGFLLPSITRQFRLRSGDVSELPFVELGRMGYDR